MAPIRRSLQCTSIAASLRMRAFTGRFSRDYWRFFGAAFCMDLGFGLFVFLFNLYLTDLHFDEQIIGRVMACFTLGNVAGTIPAMMAARRYGLRPLLLFTFACTPLFSVLRVFALWEPAQFALAFMTGAALCGWPICFSPTIAQLTTEDNRARGFSLAFATGIGLGTVAGIAGGRLPELLHSTGPHFPLVEGIRIVLLLSCAVVILGAAPLRRLSLPLHPAPSDGRVRIFHPYLLRFLPAFVVWNAVTGSFPLFGAVYLQKALGIPLGALGSVFAASQLMQFIAVLCTPMLFRRMSITHGVVLAQLGTVMFLLLLSGTSFVPAAIGFYLFYLAALFMCGPGIYQMLMEHIPEAERSSASALQNLSGALCQAGSAAISGTCIVALGYRSLLLGNAAFGVIAALLFLSLGLQKKQTAEGIVHDDFAAVSTNVTPPGTDWAVQKVVE
jgi:MFS family permease